MRIKTVEELIDVEFQSLSSPHSGKLISSLSEEEINEEKTFCHNQMIDTIMKCYVFESFDEEMSLLNSLSDSVDLCKRMQHEILHSTMSYTITV